jgi:hypothetical protein
MISGTNNTSSDIQQNRMIANITPGRLLSRVCMFTMVLQCAATITVHSTGCDHTTIQAAANAAHEED